MASFRYWSHKFENSLIYEYLIKFLHLFFFGNYFYGLCAVALTLETLAQLEISQLNFEYFVFIFFITLIFYTEAYRSERISGMKNLRSEWYQDHYQLINWTQLINIFICLLILISIRSKLHFFISSLTPGSFLLLISIPIVAFLYYGIEIRGNPVLQLRKTGWIKPLLIAFVWAGVVSIYPVYFHFIIGHCPVPFSGFAIILFLKNFLFIAILSVLFDIKDYATDSNNLIKTLAVQVGITKTIFLYVIPLSLSSLGLFIYYGIINEFTNLNLLMNSIPFILLILLAYSLHKPKSILYYLILIDGLMLLKALCGYLGLKLGTMI
jgi:hypothetical protein